MIQPYNLAVLVCDVVVLASSSYYCKYEHACVHTLACSVRMHRQTCAFACTSAGEKRHALRAGIAFQSHAIATANVAAQT
jgi:hypothetical protein